MNLENMHDKASNQKTSTVWLHFNEVPRVVRFIETESRMITARAWGKEECGVNV